MKIFTEQKPPKDKALHHTPEPLVKKLLSLVPYTKNDFVCDNASGRNMVFYNNYETEIKDWCEIDLKRDFFDYNKKVDWFITNPPFHLTWKFLEKSSKLARKGFAYILSSNSFLTLTPKRLSFLRDRGFVITKIVVFNVKKWFGRYYFVIFEENKDSIIEWLEGTW